MGINPFLENFDDDMFCKKVAYKAYNHFEVDFHMNKKEFNDIIRSSSSDSKRYVASYACKNDIEYWFRAMIKIYGERIVLRSVARQLKKIKEGGNYDEEEGQEGL